MSTLVLAAAAPAQERPVRPPRYMELRLAGVDLRRAGVETLRQRFDPGETAPVPNGHAYRWRDLQAGAVLEFVVDAESGSIRLARVAPFTPSARPPAAPFPAFRLSRPLTGAGVSLGDPLAAVERAYGRPHATERTPDGNAHWLYRAALPPDGRLPAYRARYTFRRGRLVGVAIALGE